MLNSAEALQKLIEGNRRYLEGRQLHPRQTIDRRRELIGGQQPFAAILGCSDSRVPPELIFDQGLGDLFVVRVAGNIIDDAVLGSVEFAVDKLQTPLVLVLGHTQCGAVEAAVAGGKAKGSVTKIVRAIQPAVEKAAITNNKTVNEVVKVNARLTAEKLRLAEPILSENL
ncbi:MAG: carbonic anhydrase [Calditrichaeota bacterium]|nr:carbonic anhydrase [Calditrichota bacterium]